MSILKPINVNVKTTIVYEPKCGESIHQCALAMWDQAHKFNINIIAEFNGVKIEATPFSTCPEIVAMWYAGMNKKLNRPKSIYFAWKDVLSAVKELWKSIMYYKIKGVKK